MIEYLIVTLNIFATLRLLLMIPKFTPFHLVFNNRKSDNHIINGEKNRQVLLSESFEIVTITLDDDTLYLENDNINSITICFTSYTIDLDGISQKMILRG